MFCFLCIFVTQNQTPCAFSETVSVSSQAVAVFVLQSGVWCWLLPVVSVFEEVFSCCSFSRVFADALSSVASFQADLLKNQLLWTSFIARSAASHRGSLELMDLGLGMSKDRRTFMWNFSFLFYDLG